MENCLSQEAINLLNRLAFLSGKGDSENREDYLNLNFTPVSISDLKIKYLQNISHYLSDSYFNSQDLSLRYLVKHFGKNRFINSISLKEFEDFFGKLKEKAPRGYHVYFRNVRAAFNKAVDWKYLTVNPLNSIKLPKYQRNEPEIIRLDQIGEAIKHLRSNLKDIVLFAFHTGMRLSEIRNLEWDSVDMLKRLIKVGSESFVTKSRKQRIIPMNSKVYRILSKRKRDQAKNSEVVFHKGNGFPFHKDYISKSFKDAVRKSNLSNNLKFHSLRSSFATNLGAKGVSPIIIQKLLGHSNISTTMLYVGVELESLINAIHKLNQGGQNG
ncbi:tyrosine-type recombinase/integrase [Bacteroidota bacterium]